MSDGKVVGVVWGVHARLVEELGDQAPFYEDCERVWRKNRKGDPGPNERHDWLYGLVVEEMQP